MSEKEQRQTVVKALRRLDAHSVENRVGIGTPDLNYVYGWIELKCLKRWPIKSPMGIVRLDHDLTPEQRIWLERRWEAGGEAYVLLQVEKTNEWLLFDGPTAAKIIGFTDRATLVRCAINHWTSQSQLREYLEPCLSARANCRRASASSSTAVVAS